MVPTYFGSALTLRCSTCQSVTSHLTTETKQVTDPSCYVLFPLHSNFHPLPILEAFGRQDEDLELSGFLAWTTAPWSLLSSAGIVLHPKEEYALISQKASRRCIIVSKNIFCHNFQFFLEQWMAPGSTVDSFTPQDFILGSLSGAQLQALVGTVGNPLDSSLPLPILVSDSVRVSSGTGIVHIVPGCSEADYHIGRQNALAVTCPLDKLAKFKRNFGPFPEVRELAVHEASSWVLSKLADLDRLVCEQPVVHGQAHCSECSSRLYFRLCERWFCDVDSGLIDNLTRSLDTSEFLPKRHKKAVLGLFSAWKFSTTGLCISSKSSHSQRVSIPALLCTACGFGFTSERFVVFGPEKF